MIRTAVQIRVDRPLFGIGYSVVVRIVIVVVGDFIVVAVDRVRIGIVVSCLHRVGDAVVVRVLVEGVDELVTVEVGRVKMVFTHFHVVRDGVAVAIRVVLLGADGLLFTVGQAIAIRVRNVVVQRVEWVGVVNEDLRAVGHSAVVRVLDVRVGFVIVFEAVLVLVLMAVPEAVFIAILVERVGGRGGFNVRAQADLKTVGKLVAVAIRVQRVGLPVLQVPAAVHVGILEAV